MEPILGWMKPDARDVVRLSTDGGEVQELLGRYCERDRVPLPDRRLRWAIRDPLSVRLYCDLGREGRSWRRSELSLPALLRLKIERAEDAVRAKVGGYGEHDRPLHQALAMIAERVLQRGELLRRDAIDELSATQRPCGLLSPARWSQLLDEAAEHGLILLRESDPEDRSLRGRTAYVEPAYDPLADYLLAEAASRDLAGALDRNAAPGLPDVLQARPGALEQAVVLLAEQGVDIVAQGGLLRGLPSEHREELQLGAIAALESEAARRYEGWVRERLVASMPSCRRVLAYLCVPVSRDADHPFGPRFVHETLLPFLPAKRDSLLVGPALPAGGRRAPLAGSRAGGAGGPGARARGPRRGAAAPPRLGAHVGGHTLEAPAARRARALGGERPRRAAALARPRDGDQRSADGGGRGHGRVRRRLPRGERSQARSARGLGGREPAGARGAPPARGRGGGPRSARDRRTSAGDGRPRYEGGDRARQDSLLRKALRPDHRARSGR